MTALEEYEMEKLSRGITTKRADDAGTMIGLADAAIESLKCCVLCDHYSGFDDATWCDVKTPWDEMVWRYDHCHFTPSRWTARPTGKEES